MEILITFCSVSVKLQLLVGLDTKVQKLQLQHCLESTRNRTNSWCETQQFW